MYVSRTVEEWRERRRALEGRTIGLVPTMGALHRGHASLIRRCVAENQAAVVSIFVNPSQFNDPKDLERYPITVDTDLSLLRSLGVHEVLMPPAAELYPHGYRFSVDAAPLRGRGTGQEACPTECMEGVHRPGFFAGVMTIVLKLLNLVRADRAYFGEKDYQQLRVVTEMAAEFFTGTEIVACPTVRAESGLAESSRNALLSEAGRERATVIYRALTTAPTADAARAEIEAAGLRVDYVEEHWGRRFAAAFLEGVRLIDNVAIAEER